jgi:hypothetical protein
MRLPWGVATHSLTNHEVKIETVLSINSSLGIDPHALEYKAVTLSSEVVCRKYVGAETENSLQTVGGWFYIKIGEVLLCTRRNFSDRLKMLWRLKVVCFARYSKHVEGKGKVALVLN